MNRLKLPKTFVVTGGLGFIGSHFIESALEYGHKVINIDKVTYAANVNLKFKGDYTFRKCDISELDQIPHCDIIVNFAAESHVDNSIQSSLAFVKSNVLGVHHLLELIKERKIRNLMNSWNYEPPLFVQISTDEVFGDILKGEFSEEDRHKPSNPYSATKSCAEQLVVSWGRTYGLPFIITRTTNNYGPRQFPEKLIPNAISRLTTGKNAIVFGDGEHVRNWIHVKDNVDALLCVINSGELNSSYHISSNDEFSVNQIVTFICERLGKDVSQSVDTTTDRSGSDLRYALNCDKVKELGWTQKRTFLDSLADLIKEIKDNQ